MITDYINEILTTHRDNLSIDELIKVLKEYNIYAVNNNVYKNSKYFSLFNGRLFLKQKFIEQKESFFLDFDDYIKTKIIDPQIRKNIIENLTFFMPEILFVEYLELNLEDKILIFDILIILMQKPRVYNDEFRNFVNSYFDFYSLVIINLLLLLDTYDNNFDEFIDIIDKIDGEEVILKEYLFNILTKPSLVSKKIEIFECKFLEIKENLTNTFDNLFSETSKYSKPLLKRVVTKELNNFTTLSILGRLEFEELLDYLLIISEDKKPKLKRNLFKDIGLE